jgi:hypothetical protein
VTEDVHVIAAVFANELGDVIGALIAAVALAILQRLGRSWIDVRKALAYTTSSCSEEPPTGLLFLLRPSY